jgi:hypothetical protein
MHPMILDVDDPPDNLEKACMRLRVTHDTYFLYMKGGSKQPFSRYPRHQININRKIQIQ